MAATGVEVVLIVGNYCIRMHNRPVCAGVDPQRTLQVHFPYTEWSVSITQAEWVLSTFCEGGSVLTGLTGQRSRSMKTSCGVVQGTERDKKIILQSCGGSSPSRNSGCHVALWAADYRWSNAGKEIRSKSDRHRRTQHRAETKRGSVPARDNDAFMVPVGSGTKAGKDAQNESRSHTLYDMTEFFSNASNCR